MPGVLVDSNVILDLVLNDPHWADWSSRTLNSYAQGADLCINPVIYAEVSIGFQSIEELEEVILMGGFRILEIPKEALFLAGKIFLRYRKNKGTKRSPLPDLYIGAQASVFKMDLITRDTSRYRTYFPTLKIIHPE